MPPTKNNNPPTDNVDNDDSDRSSDEDFNPDGPADNEEEAEVSDSDNEVGQDDQKKKPRAGKKRQRGKDDAAELDSGDEATIQERKRKRRRGDKKSEYVSSDEEADGVWVKTRSQRKTEHRERKPLASTASATIDVDAAWARLSALAVTKPIVASTSASADPTGASASAGQDGETAGNEDDEYITIRRTTRFAGEVTTEQRRVHKHSAEAKIYLAEQEAAAERKKSQRGKQDGAEDALPENDGAAAGDKEKNDGEDGEPQPPLRRPLKRPSRFEPNPAGLVKALPPHLQLRWPRQAPALPGGGGGSGGARGATTAVAAAGMPAATKLNTVEKSRQDWAGFVDQAGLVEELELYGKSKESYLGRKEFLSGVEARQEGERRDARIKGM